MKKLILAIAAAAAAAVSVNAYAACTVDSSAVPGTVKVSGTVESGAENEYLSLQIIPADKDIKALYLSPDENPRVYADQLKSGEGGSFEAEIRMDVQTGSYKLFISSGSGQTETEFLFVNAADNKAALEKLLAAKGDKAQFAAAAEENAAVLLFDNKYYGSVSRSELFELLRGAIGNFSSEDGEEAAAVFDTCCLITALNEGRVSSLAQELKDEDITDSDILDWFGRFSSDTDADKWITSKLSRRSFRSRQEFENGFVEALVLYTAYKPGGSGNIKAVLTLFEDYTGISTAGISDKTYSAISGKQYTGYSELKSAITAAQSSSSSGGSSGGGGGGGGGGVSTVKTSKSGTGTAYTPSIQSSEIPPQLITFSDIDAYPWAYEAITSLANRGIVSGTGDSEYTPERNVTREEFIKMLNGALGIAEAEYSSIYDDVAADAWYAPYVIAAAQNGICQGIGDREFGSGLELTRQDMACLIYNAVKDKLTAYEAAESFADLPDIADYAVEAVTALHNAGLMNGKDNNIFDPRASATRAETAVVIYSVLNMLK